MDAATDESMQDFIKNLVNTKEDTINKVRTTWLQVRRCEIVTTPAHEALLKIVNLLTENKKSIFVYTGNIDGIHHKFGIQISEQYFPEEYVTLVKYPPEEKLKNSKTTVFVCEQPFDFDGALSTIYTRKNLTKELTFYSFNIHPGSFIVYEGFGVDKLINKPEESMDMNKFIHTSLEIKWIKGSVHDTFINLYNLLEKSDINTKDTHPKMFNLSLGEMQPLIFA